MGIVRISRDLLKSRENGTQDTNTTITIIIAISMIIQTATVASVAAIVLIFVVIFVIFLYVLNGLDCILPWIVCLHIYPMCVFFAFADACKLNKNEFCVSVMV